MSDIYVAIATLFVLGLFCLRLGFRNAQYEKYATASVALCLTLLLLFSLFVHGNAWVAWALPVSNAIVLANWLPLGASFLAGNLLGNQNIVLWRRSIIAFAVLTASWYSVLSTVYPQSFPTSNQFKDGICLQSSQVSCAAGAAVTLLDHYGIDSTEQEMASLCLTGKQGTHALGIYRGLKLKAEGHDLRVRVAKCELDELNGLHIPLLTSISLPSVDESPSLLPINSSKVQHSVVLLGFAADGKVILGNPAVGLQLVDRYEFQRRWSGTGFYFQIVQ